MDNIARYEKIITASMKIHQAKIEITRLRNIINNNLLVSEAKDECNFSSTDVAKAIKILSDEFKLIRAQFVESQLVYMDVTVYLHSDMENLGGKAMKHIMDGE
ncbi:MAG: hypothetical protein GY845_03150 [Planctomycetes bacterium]|nr:hypothetical protein [Planctomycetota bacterium]